jgi:acyl dehydratase
MNIDHYLPHGASLGSPGIDEVRWLTPVHAGDEISVRVRVVSARRSQSRPDRGVIHGFIEVLNQNQEVVMTWKGMGIMLCRDKGQ